MLCQQCGTNNPGGLSFCQNCGAPFPQFPGALPAFPAEAAVRASAQTRRRHVPGCLVGCLLRLALLLALIGAVVVGWVFFWPRLSGSAPLLTYQGQTDGIGAEAWSPDSTRVASSGSAINGGPSNVQIWDVRDGRTLLTYRGQYGVSSLAWSPDGTRLASLGLDNPGELTVQVWDAQHGTHLLTLHTPVGQMKVVAWSPDSKYLVTGGFRIAPQGMVQVWDATSGKVVFTYPGQLGEINAVGWSPDGKRIAVGGYDHTVQVWDAFSGEHLLIYRGHPAEVAALAWSPNGQWIASADSNAHFTNAEIVGDDSTVQVWDARTGDRQLSLPLDVNALAWSPDSQRIVTANSRVLVWDAFTGDHLYAYDGNTLALGGTLEGLNAAWSPDGTRIVTGGPESPAQVWQPRGDGSFLGHAYLFDVLGVLLLTLLASGIAWFLSSSSATTLRSRTVPDGQAATRGKRLRLGLLLVCLCLGLGALVIVGISVLGWNWHLISFLTFDRR